MSEAQEQQVWALQQPLPTGFYGRKTPKIFTRRGYERIGDKWVNGDHCYKKSPRGNWYVVIWPLLEYRPFSE